MIKNVTAVVLLVAILLTTVGCTPDDKEDSNSISEHMDELVEVLEKCTKPDSWGSYFSGSFFEPVKALFLEKGIYEITLEEAIEVLTLVSLHDIKDDDYKNLRAYLQDMIKE